MPVDILHILGSAQYEGASIARIVKTLANKIDPAQYRLHIWFLQQAGPLASELSEAGAQVRIINWHRGTRDPVGMWRFRSILRREKFAIIHQHFGWRSVRWLAQLGSGASLIVHLHGRINECQLTPQSPIMIRDADLAIATSRAVAQQVVGAAVPVVYPGIPINEINRNYLSPSRLLRKTVLGTAARLVPIKGIVHLIYSLLILREEFPNFRLEIAGAGPELPLLAHEVKTLGLEDRVVFLGWQADLTPVLAGWDIFVLPSLEEGFGIAALEAMAAGLPVVATAVGGVPELVQDGQTGWLVPPADPRALADRLRVLLLNAEQQRRMGEAGQIRAREKFSADRMVAQISQIYDELLRPRSQ